MPVLAALVLAACTAGSWIEPPEWFVSVAVCVPVSIVTLWLGGARAGIALCAYLVTAVAGWNYVDGLLPHKLEGEAVAVEGRVISFPEQQGAVFIVELRGASVGGRMWPASGTHIRVTSYDPAVRPLAGETWRLLVRLKRPHGYVNPGVFDRSVWFLETGIAAVGYVLVSPLNRRLAAPRRHASPLGWRLDLRERLLRIGGSSPAVPFLVGLTTGARDLLSATHWRVLRDSGTSHLLAISGLHVGLVAVGCWFLGGAIGRLTGVPVASVCSLAGATLYALLAGLTVPTQRALLMVLFVLFLRQQRRYSRSLDALAFALVVVLLAFPHALLAAGFWLSFLAVLLLLVCAGPVSSADGMIGRAWRTQWLLTFGLALPTVYFFKQFSLLALPANLLVVPVFAFGIVPLVLVGAGMLYVHEPTAGALLAAGSLLLEWVMHLLGQLTSLQAAISYLPGISLLMLLLGGLGALLVALPRPLNSPVIGLLLCLLATALPQRAVQQPRVHVLDVGQGLAVLVQTRAGNILYDAGPAWPGNDAGATVVVPRLRALGVESIDTLIVSHADNDHRGGVASVMADPEVGKLYRQSPDKSAGRPGHACRRGIAWRSGNAELRFLHPRSTAGWSDNNASCVLQLKINDHSMLLPGDIESAAEAVLLSRAELHPPDVVVVPHHGSNTSSTQALVAALRPEYAVVAAGYRNRWGFPAAAVTQRWRSAGSCVLDVSRTGSLEFAYRPGEGFRLVAQAASSWSRPWPVRASEAAVQAC